MSAFRLVRPDTAFSVAPIRGRKRPRQFDDKHLAWLRTLPCVVTGRRPVEAAHIRYADPIYGKRETGMGEKPDDRWCLPLCPEMHRSQHDAGNERAWWEGKGIDPCRVALALHGVSGDDDAAETIIRLLKPSERRP
jgi:hypothetical protein